MVSLLLKDKDSEWERDQGMKMEKDVMNGVTKLPIFPFLLNLKCTFICYQWNKLGAIRLTSKLRSESWPLIFAIQDLSTCLQLRVSNTQRKLLMHVKACMHILQKYTKAILKDKVENTDINQIFPNSKWDIHL